MLALMLAAALAGPEENTFALVANGLEWATPDLRVEVGGELPVATVLSWPIVPASFALCTLGDCRSQVILEPFAEPQLRPGSGETRLLLGSQALLLPSQRGLGLLVDGGGLRASGAWGWAAGGGLVWSGGANRGIRGRFVLRGRYVGGIAAPRGDVSLDVGLPMAVRGWRAIARGESIDGVSTCPSRREPDPAPDRTLTGPGTGCTPGPVCGPGDCGRVPDGCGGFVECGPCWEDRPGCDPYPCMPGMCGEVSNGCGGTMFCGMCEEELLPACDPVGIDCLPGMCGPIADGCGGTIYCGGCEEELLPACDPVGCPPGACGMTSDGCGGTQFCGECFEEELPGCDPIVTSCLPGMCGEVSDGCGGTLFCGPCGPPACEPMTCPAGTCGPQPDGCGGTLDCGTCAP